MVTISHFKDFGIDFSELQTQMLPLYDSMPWDRYDTRVYKLRGLEKNSPVIFSGSEGQELYRKIFSGETKIHTVATIAPFRKRTAGLIEVTGLDFSLPRELHQPCFTLQSLEAYSQPSTDYRAQPRTFAALPKSVAESNWLKLLLLGGIKTMMSELGVNATHKVAAEIHLMRLVVRPGEERTNTPEGRHTDGADFLMTCLLNKERGEGAQSLIWDGDTIAFQHELQPGEILLMRDLVHEVTNFRCTSKFRYAHRDILGIDFTIIKDTD